MALIDKASLLMVPSTYEDGTLYNILPSGNKAPDETGNHNGYDQTRADFTFSRGFNLAATRVNADGLIEKGRENLLLQSNQFDTTWTNSNATLTSGQSGYDGSSNAWKIEATATLANVTQSVSSSGVNTFSVYAKAGTEDGIFLRVDGGNNPRCFYNIKDGVVGSPSGSPVETSMEDVGDGWYRCKLVVNSAITSAKIYVADDSNSFPSSGSIYIQNAQLEVGLVATDYIETGATTATAGVLENTPRIDYSSGAGALLLESQRTNLLPHSEYFGASGWGLDGGTQSITTNYGISPEGVKNAARLQLDKTGTTYSRLYYDAGSLGQATISVYMKSNTSQTQNVGLRYDGTAVNCEVTTEWKRFDLTATSTAVSRFQILLFDSIAENDETADILIYGAQLESSASYPSSYVPTYGSAATRGADSCTGGGDSDSINSTEGVLYWECSALDDDAGTTRVLSISNGTNANSLYSGYNTTTNVVQAQLVVGGVAQTNMTHTVSDRTEFLKVAVLYKNNDHKMYINGEEVETDTSGSVPSANTFNTFNFDLGQGSFDFFGNVKQVAVFDEALSDAELVTLTT